MVKRLSKWNNEWMSDEWKNEEKSEEKQGRKEWSNDKMKGYMDKRVGKFVKKWMGRLTLLSRDYRVTLRPLLLL